ncbi:hypothetical protein SVIO_001290 [Streptomyces violaceusniger]|uniref:Uncharacterized protein n=1 Tax=Streptomyces violaceusniger TaxID=68280 RepID=A0A4D4KRH8_STRVO|nr:hypothetical protein SVIO_001290 [Streptomyces violaceusniger]
MFSASRYIESMRTGTVLAPTAAPWGDGEWLATQTRDPEDASQRFNIEFDGNDGVRIREPGGRCATVTDLAPHTLSLRDCSVSLSHERFDLVSLGNEQYQIRSVRTGRCVEQRRGQTSYVGMERCANVDAQHWTLPQTHQDLSEPNFETRDLPVAYTRPEGLQNVYTGQMLTSEPRGLPATRVRAEPRTTAFPSSADWRLDWVGEYLRLRDRGTGRCVEISDPPPGSDAAAGVDLKSCTDSSAQLWKVDPYSGKPSGWRAGGMSCRAGSAWPWTRRTSTGIPSTSCRPRSAQPAMDRRSGPSPRTPPRPTRAPNTVTP